MPKTAVTSKINQTDTRIVFISHMSEWFSKKLDKNEKKLQLLAYTKHIQCTKYNVQQIQNLTKQSPVCGVRNIF